MFFFCCFLFVSKLTNSCFSSMKGVPNFWISIFRNVSLLQEMLEDHDVPILQHLIDITVDLTDNPMGFKLFFHFSPNEYFSNSVLTKEYELKCVPDEGSDAFDFEGPAIIKCKVRKVSRNFFWLPTKKIDILHFYWFFWTF